MSILICSRARRHSFISALSICDRFSGLRDFLKRRELGNADGIRCPQSPLPGILARHSEERVSPKIAAETHPLDHSELRCRGVFNIFKEFGQTLTRLSLAVTLTASNLILRELR